MKIFTIVAMVAVTGTASARNIDLSAAPRITVCVERTSSDLVMVDAKLITSKIFATAGVNVNWSKWDRCPADSLYISLQQDARPSDHPRALAYALPYEGTHIVLFWDRITNTAGPIALPFLLAHVLVHEITHILQGVDHHSDSGVMKAEYSAADIAGMRVRALPFTAEDLYLIHAGMKSRWANRTQIGDRTNGDIEEKNITSVMVPRTTPPSRWKIPPGDSLKMCLTGSPPDSWHSQCLTTPELDA